MTSNAVNLTCADGTSCSFTYVGIVDDVQPRSAPATGGTLVIITGRSLANGFGMVSRTKREGKVVICMCHRRGRDVGGHELQCAIKQRDPHFMPYGCTDNGSLGQRCGTFLRQRSELQLDSRMCILLLSGGSKCSESVRMGCA